MMANQILTVTISKTSRGDQDYMQIMSEDFQRVNIVLIADEIKFEDKRRTDGKKTKRP